MTVKLDLEKLLSRVGRSGYGIVTVQDWLEARVKRKGKLELKRQMNQIMRVLVDQV